MGLGGQVDDAVHVLLLHQFENAVKVADIHLNKAVVGLVLDVLEVGQVAGIRELVQVNDLVFRVLVHEQPHYVTANKTGAAGDDEGAFHKDGLRLGYFFNSSHLLHKTQVGAI